MFTETRQWVVRENLPFDIVCSPTTRQCGWRSLWWLSLLCHYMGLCGIYWGRPLGSDRVRSDHRTSDSMAPYSEEFLGEKSFLEGLSQYLYINKFL